MWETTYLHPEFLKAKNDWNALNVNEPCKWAFEFPFVNELFCDQLLQEVNELNQWSTGGTVKHKDQRINNIENVRYNTIK